MVLMAGRGGESASVAFTTTRAAVGFQPIACRLLGPDLDLSRDRRSSPAAGNAGTMRREMDEQIAEMTVGTNQNSGAATQDRSPMLEISNAMVGLYKEAFGRGPTKARAQFAGADTLVVILEASLTVAERNLVAMGEHQRLREARLFFTYALEDQFRAIVEEALDRRTVAFVSGIDTTRDVAIEVFTLEPPVEDGSSPSGG
jgi:uncharacterized protein YbcI